jgi:stearoyl-CoA desaturase (delta-9 desaturase)
MQQLHLSRFKGGCPYILDPGQIDIGFNFIQLLERMRLAWDIQTPEALPLRPGITPD